MIVNWFLDILGAVIAWFLDLLPDFEVPGWVKDVGTAAATVANALSGSSAFLPWSVLFLAIGLVIASYAIAVAIRGLRIAASFLTLGGGS